ncbi:hypothetical protein I7I50_08103 [Histoplasma capsulatum G186AR]|uniref:Uncharacterized protein n=1 Tax=Ajellomyces capsulatus TaxID=5037 RepID=A0A8H7YFA7_AJECA|nr:hypothetical protein I7I52_08619 [Histoplasma capsulatum]QSS68628.1 hypothetical protein I7I50_08103 [Histoplasma capsulatum G186AR]
MRRGLHCHQSEIDSAIGSFSAGQCGSIHVSSRMLGSMIYVYGFLHAPYVYVERARTKYNCTGPQYSARVHVHAMIMWPCKRGQRSEEKHIQSCPANSNRCTRSES